MDRWNGKVAIVTGASAGIGLAVAKALIYEGLTVVGFARRKQHMEESMVDVKGPGKFHAKECDITKEESVIKSFNWVKSTFGTVNILINNAGTLAFSNFLEASISDMENTVQVNLMGPVYCSKVGVQIMKENGQEGHLININSVIGHNMPPAVCHYPFNIYPATKHAITALSQILTNELVDSKIRVTSISPGLVRTPMMDVIFHANEKVPALNPEDVANFIIYALGAPAHVEIKDIILNPKGKNTYV